MATLEPCSVVVDTRNMHGHSRKLLGEPRYVTVHGIKSMFSSLKFDVQDIFMGTATKVAGSTPSVALKETRQTNARRAEKWKSEGAEVLEGILAERGGVIEEKQVDVLCALKVFELAVIHRDQPHTIFILTEDMDLDPAANLAKSWGAKVIRVAPGHIHQRTNNNSGWMLITRKDFHALCNFPGTPETATKLRRSLVRTIKDGAKSRNYSFLRYEYKPDYDYAVLLSNQGLYVKMKSPPTGLKHKDKIPLCVRDIRLNGQNQTFPEVYVGQSHDGEYLKNIVAAKVLHWTSQDRISVEVDTDENPKQILVPTGEALTPGDDVSLMLHNGSKVGDKSYIYLGPNKDLDCDAINEKHLQFGTVTKIERDLGFVRVSSGQNWVMKVSQTIKDIQVGSKVRVADSGFIHPNTGLHLCFPLSSAL